MDPVDDRVRGQRHLGVRSVSRYARDVPDRARSTPRKLKTVACLLAAFVLLALPTAGVSVASAASIGGNSFNELSQKAQAEEEKTTSTATTSETGTAIETKNSKTTIFIAVGIALVLLVGIASVIVRDARRVAPAGDVAEIEARAVRDNAVQMRNRRAKAKAARQQRKKNLKKR
jgi:ABC-type Fe3+ transport system permease subunit